MTTQAELDAAMQAMRSIPFSSLIPHRPTGKQLAFCANMEPECLYGGTARSMKSWAALMAASQFSCVPGYAAIIFRRKLTSLKLPDGLIPTSMAWFSKTDAKWSGEDNRWTFPSGATLSFGYLDNDDDLMRYHSSAYQFILFEELPEWPSDTAYTYMVSRLTPKVDADGQMGRCACHGWSVADVPLRLRGTANPGGPGQAWVREHFILPWRNGVKGIFQPASYRDNPYIDPDAYELALAGMREIDRKRLLGGDWDITAPGERFSRDWFKKHEVPEHSHVARTLPADVKMLRFWDMAGTKPNRKNKDPDFTCGALVAYWKRQEIDHYLILDIQRFRTTSGEVRRKMRRQSEVDDRIYKRHVPVRVEREPGSQAMAAAANLKTHFKGINFRCKPSRIPKEDRIEILSSEAEIGYEQQEGGVWVVAGADFVEGFLDEAEAYGNPGVHDDQLDAVSGAIMALSKGAGSKSTRASAADRAAAEGEEPTPRKVGYPDVKAIRGFGYANARAAFAEVDNQRPERGPSHAPGLKASLRLAQRQSCKVPTRKVPSAR